MNDLDRNRYGSPAGFRLDRTDGRVFGVCAGLVNYMGVDANIIRLVFIAGTVFGFGSFIVIYLAIALLAK